MDYSFHCPSLPEQRAIASILGSLDDKIALNLQMNSILETIGQALFRRWFVDFEFPNEGGKPYRSSGREMVETELGKVPMGWTIVKLENFGDIVCGKTPSKSIQENKTIPSNSICVSCIATVGLVGITDKDSQTNQQINSVIPKKDFFEYYLFFQMKAITDLLKNLASGGSTTLNLNTGRFSEIEIVNPDENILANFHYRLKPIFENILINQFQIQKLSKIRDALLPKLMSGKIRANVG